MISSVGNDVVDLGDPYLLGSERRQRYVDRICCDSERRQIAQARDPLWLLWALFAAKEAAFKAISKRRPGVIFAHSKFVVEPDLRSVRHDDLTLALRVTRCGEAIHAIATLGPDDATIGGVHRVRSGADLSRAARRGLRTALAPVLSCRASELTVVRSPIPGSWNGFGPPSLRKRGEPVAIDVSLSHDRHYVAFAALDARRDN